MDALRRTVLLVDDEPDVLDMLALVLKGAGSFVLKARHGREALDLAQAHGPIDLLVTDVKMPIMDGVELLRQFVHVQPAVPVIVMSEYHANALSAWMFLAKPFLPVAFLAAVRDALRNSADLTSTFQQKRFRIALRGLRAYGLLLSDRCRPARTYRENRYLQRVPSIAKQMASISSPSCRGR